jgi:hypothetical protein
MSEMDTSGEARVPYAVKNIERCMCPQCPVQADSRCISDKIGNLKNEMKDLGIDEVSAPQKVPGVYCSSGTATCSDLDPNKDCICKTCSVWDDYCLEHANTIMYFCNNGRAI